MDRKIEKFNENTEEKVYVYILIDSQAHSREAVVEVYDSFEKAMESEMWEEYGEVPNEKGIGNHRILSIYKKRLY